MPYDRSKSAADEHRSGGVSEHLGGHAAQQHSRKPAAPVRRYDDEVATHVFGNRDDRFVRTIVLDLQALTWHVDSLGGLRDPVQYSACMRFYTLGMMRECLRHIIH